jgi:hypothetical protein
MKVLFYYYYYYYYFWKTKNLTLTICINLKWKKISIYVDIMILKVQIENLYIIAQLRDGLKSFRNPIKPLKILLRSTIA